MIFDKLLKYDILTEMQCMCRPSEFNLYVDFRLGFVAVSFFFYVFPDSGFKIDAAGLTGNDGLCHYGGDGFHRLGFIKQKYFLVVDAAVSAPETPTFLPYLNAKLSCCFQQFSIYLFKLHK